MGSTMSFVTSSRIPDRPSQKLRNGRLRNVACPSVRQDGAEIPLSIYHQKQLELPGTTLHHHHNHHRSLAPLTWLLILEESVRKHTAASSKQLISTVAVASRPSRREPHCRMRRHLPYKPYILFALISHFKTHDRNHEFPPSTGETKL